MVEAKQRVIVIDDDEVVLVAISELLEEVGCTVFTQTSPIGATQVILREAIKAVIIDINLPVMQGDNVIRLFRSWDKMKDLPIVVLSGAVQEKLAAIQRELPGIKIVPKGEMRKRLAGTVLDALARAARSETSPSSPVTDTKRAQELSRRLGHELGDAMSQAQEVWDEVREGRIERVAPLTDTMIRLRGQAHLLGLARAAQLSEGLSDVLLALRAGVRTSPAVDQAVRQAIAALAALKGSSSVDLPLPPDPLAKALKRAADELRHR